MSDPRSSETPDPLPREPETESEEPRSRRQRLGLALLAGALVPLSLQPWGLPWLLPVGFALLATVIKGASFRQSFLIGGVFGLAINGVGLPWIATAVTRFSGIFIFDAPDSVAATMTGVGAFFLWWPAASLGWGLWAAMITICPTQGVLRAIWAGLGVMLLESYWPRIFQWTLGAAYATENPSMSWWLLQWFGVEELVLLAVFSGFLAAPCVTDRSRTYRQLWILVPALLLMVLPAIPLPQAPLHPSVAGSEAGQAEELVVSIIQPAIPLEMRHGREQSDAQRRKIRSLIEQASVGDPNLVLLPEAILPQAWKIEWLQQWCQDWLRCPTLIGVTLIEPDGYSNGLALLIPRSDPDSGQRWVDVQIGRKKRLVPFGEMIPFGETLSSWGIELPLTSLVAGSEAVVFSADSWFPRLGASICYEGILSATAAETGAQGARWHANLTEDLWYGDWLEPAQHLQLQRSRAIESGLVWFRSVNAGISAAIDPRSGGYRSILASRSRSDHLPASSWSPWQPTSDSGQVSLPQGDVGILQIRLTNDFSPQISAPLSLPESAPLLWLYVALALFWWNLKRFQTS
ncbi:MAG: apolipoprotein N-acyltransferase [Planctomycetota bacterium]